MSVSYYTGYDQLLTASPPVAAPILMMVVSVAGLYLCAHGRTTSLIGDRLQDADVVSKPELRGWGQVYQDNCRFLDFENVGENKAVIVSNTDSVSTSLTSSVISGKLHCQLHDEQGLLEKPGSKQEFLTQSFAYQIMRVRDTLS